MVPEPPLHAASKSDEAAAARMKRAEDGSMMGILQQVSSANVRLACRTLRAASCRPSYTTFRRPARLFGGVRGDLPNKSRRDAACVRYLSVHATVADHMI